MVRVVNNMYQLAKILLATMIFDIRRLLCTKSMKPKDRKGIYIEPEFLAEIDINALYEEVSDIVLNNSADNGGAVFQERGAGGHDDGMLDIKHIDKVIPDFLNKIKIDKVLEIVNKEIGLNLNVKNINCYWNQGVENTRGFHADNHTKDQYKAFIYLTDVLEDSDGPYSYIPGSHLPSFYRYKCIVLNYLNKRPLTDYHPTGDNKSIFKAKAPKGSLIISNQNGAHRGWPQGKDNKRALVSINLI